jgi:nucleoside-diphosphate-sugar epimerase
LNVWVTGGAGFLGQRLTRALRRAGHRVAGLSRRPCPDADRSISIDLASDDAPGKLQVFVEEWGQPDAVVHAACLKPGKHRLSEYVGSNVSATANLLDALDGFAPGQLVYTSTLSVLGLPSIKPAANPNSSRNDFPYLITKRCSEQLVEAFQDRSEVVVLRLPTLYGAGQAESFIDGLARLAIGDQAIELFGRGETVRDALHVDDAVGAIVSCLQAPPETPFCCLDLGCGQRVTTRQYVEAMVAALDSRSDVIPVDRPSPQQMDLQADIAEARRLIGFDPMPLSASMERYASELRA